MKMARHLCHCEAFRMDSDSIDGLEEGFKRLRLAPAATLLRKHLSKRVFALLKYRCTPLGANLFDVARIGMLHHDSLCGVFAPDQYAYDTYSVLLDPLLDERHFGFELTDVHPPDDWGYRKIRRIQRLDPDNKYIISTRVRCSRNLDGYRFSPTMSPEELREVEKLCVELLYILPWEYSGKYLPLQCIPQYMRYQLARAHCFFDEADKYENTGNVRRHWPTGRGVYFNDDRSFAVLINDKDHLRVISISKGEDLVETYRKVACVTPMLDRRLIPAVHERLGYLTVCPGDVGTGLRISVFMRIPDRVPREALAGIAKVYHLEVKYMDHCEKDVVCVSNLRTLGCSQYEIFKDFHHGLRELIMVTHFHSMKFDSIPEEKKVEVDASEDEAVEEEDEELEDEDEGEICRPRKISWADEEEPLTVIVEEEPGRIHDTEVRAHRKTKECIREANRRRVARALRKKPGKDWPPAKDRLFPKRKKVVKDVSGDSGDRRGGRRTRFRRSINDRKCVSEESQATIEAGGIGFKELTYGPVRRGRSAKRSKKVDPVKKKSENAAVGRTH